MPPGDPDDFRFQRHGRNPRTVAILGAVYLVLIAAILLIDAAWWLMAALALTTLPALWDIYRNPAAGLDLTAGQLRWYTGRREGRLLLYEVDHMRFDTRWDFSVRVTAVLKAKDKRIRLPYECLPPHRAFEAALNAHGMAVQRHHFSFF